MGGEMFTASRESVNVSELRSNIPIDAKGLSGGFELIVHGVHVYK